MLSSWYRPPPLHLHVVCLVAAYIVYDEWKTKTKGKNDDAFEQKLSNPLYLSSQSQQVCLRVYIPKVW